MQQPLFCWSIHIYLCKCGFQTSETAILQDSESRCLMPIYHVCVIFVSWAFLTFRNDTLFTISANTEFRIAEHLSNPAQAALTTIYTEMIVSAQISIIESGASTTGRPSKQRHYTFIE